MPAVHRFVLKYVVRTDERRILMWRISEPRFRSAGGFSFKIPLVRAFLFSFIMLLLQGCISDSVRFPNTTRADADTITAYLSKPEGDGPFPAVLLLHGCGGLDRDGSAATWRALRRYEDALNDAGFVTLIVDSHGSRGKRMEELWATSCRAGVEIDRLLDVTGSIRYLKTLPFVKPKIGAVGLSQGGSVVINATGWKKGPLRKQVLSAAVAIYPSCRHRPKDVRIPLLILIGDADNITPAERCTYWLGLYENQVVKRLDDEGKPIGILPELVIYPGVHHSYDLPLRGMYQLPLGTIAPDGGAASDTRRRIVAFFKKHLGA